jgi:glycosyltransferase involved in cell wall biosynthesis
MNSKTKNDQEPATISVVIPVFNEGTTTLQLLTALSRQYIPHGTALEVVVVDNNSTDDSVAIIHKFRKETSLVPVVVVSEHIRHVCVARNRGARVATGNILVFLDADNTVGTDFIADVVRAVRDDEHHAGNFFTLPTRAERSDLFVFLMLEMIKILIVQKPFGKSFCVREVFAAVGGFNEAVSVGTNLDFLSRVRKHLLDTGGSFTHLGTVSVYASLRRFKKEGYARVLFAWFSAYLGFSRVPYSQTYKKRED